ncbi:TOMM precursor leader peptide-binding protein [Streptomyces ureilyticus]|uniref:TOMM leader peptide-binding protein n=1 Tax=Streptomyces ureilyticus TaxID=1775131 RepID=A0ABX0DY00_9ACTN|nr:TOMM precursor leader peptide-binding protein [Streptomyces ureilyticus]NGO43907.1 TOMM precursor leader peptide-binding protein [Streptomyces ureilyticus]
MTVTDPVPTGLPVGFKRHLRVETVSGEAVYLLSDQGTTALRGRQIEALAPLLDGTRTLPAVIADATDSVPPAQAGRLIAALARADLVGYRDPGADAAAEAYWELAGIGGPGVVAAVRSTPVRVAALGRTDGSVVRAECRAAGLVLAESEEQAAFGMVVCDDYLDPELAAVDARHRAAGLPWLLARSRGPEVWVGPVFGAPDGPCWSCLAHRLRGHRWSQAPVWNALGLSGPLPLPEASLTAVRSLGLQTTVLEALKWAAGMRYAGQGTVCRLDTRTLRTSHHPVARRPQCPECGDAELVASLGRSPVVPVSRPKASGGGANHRALSAADVLSRYRHLVDPVTGIVAGLRPVTDTPEGLNRWVSGRNLALRGHAAEGLRSHCGGKGVTAEQAEAGALCEAVERYCGTRQGDEPAVRDSLAGLGEDAIHPNDVQLFAERQFRDRERWNARNAAVHTVPPRFDEGAVREWTPLWSLTSHRQRLLPTSMLYFGPAPDGTEPAPWADSNGNAAGSSLEDAVVQGFLELVERDAVALWWYNRLRRPAVDLDAFDEPWLARARTAYGKAGRSLWVLDLTADFGIPVMAAVSRCAESPQEKLSFGFGAHFDPRLALQRAVTEMCQLLPPAQAEESVSQMLDIPRELRNWWSTATVRNQPYLLPDPAESARRPGDYRYVPQNDLRADVAAAESMVRDHGMELLVLNQTRPDVELPVVKVVVPGLRHFWARFGPGRLFDVPVRMGWCEQPTPYEDLNPVPLFV